MGKLEELEKKRESLKMEIIKIGDMRRGSVSQQFVPVQHKGEKMPILKGPYYVYTAKQKGKSIGKHLKVGPELEKYRREVNNYHRFQQLIRELVSVNEKICELSPLPRENDKSEIEELKKTAEQIQEEILKEINKLLARAFREKEKEGDFDLGALEIAIRSSMHEVGGKLLESIINSDGGAYRGRKLSCECGEEKNFIEYRYKKIHTVLSKIEVKRSYYYCDECNEGVCPKDKELAGIELNTKSVERISESIGEEILKIERQWCREALSGKVISMEPIPILYVAIDGTAVPTLKGWKEAKLGCCFTQSTRDNEGNPVRDPHSTTYTGAIENSELFGQRIFTEATMRGIQSAEKVVVIGDGAKWIWNIADEHFYSAIQIVDLYHAREHIWDLGKLLYGIEADGTAKWVKARHLELENGDIESLVDSLRRLIAESEEEEEKIRQEIGYFENNKKRMRYREFRDEGLFIGSGVMEAGCKSVIAHRLKQSGMRWTVDGANTILSLRTCQFNSSRWEDYWADRCTA